MSEERRVAELETAMVRAGNKLTVLENSNRAQKENITHLNQRLVKLARELVDFATRLDKLENEVRPRSLTQFWAWLKGRFI